LREVEVLGEDYNMSYRKKHIKSNVRKMKPKRSILKSLWFWTAILVLIIVGITIYFLLFFFGVQVKNVEVYGNKRVLIDDIKSLAFEDLNHKFLSLGPWAVVSKSIFLLDVNKIENQLLNNFPKIENVKVSKIFFQTIEINVKERIPTAVFCPTAGLGRCYLVDAKGITFELAPEMPPEEFFIVRQKDVSSQIGIGQHVVGQNIMSSLLKLQRNLQDKFQINITQALAESPVKLIVTTSEDWQIYFDTSSDTDMQITKLDLLLSKEISEPQRHNLRYINLIPNSKAIICDNSTCGG